MALSDTRAAAVRGFGLGIGGLAMALHGRLFPFVPAALALGIGIYFALRFEPSLAACLSLAIAGAALALGLRKAPRRFLVPAIGLALALCGVALASLRAHTVAGPVLPFRYYGPVEGRIVDIDRSFSDALRITLDRIVLLDVAPTSTPLRLRIALHGYAAAARLSPGLTVAATAHLAPPEGPVSPGGFDFQRLAWFDSLGAVGYTRSPVVVIAPPEPGPALLAFRARMHLSGAITAAIPGQPGALAAAFMTGDRSGISAATNDVMRASNLSHLISISGLHMGLLVGTVFGFVRYGLALVPYLALRLNSKRVAAVVALLAATFYLALAGPDVATRRAYVMAAVMLAAILCRRTALSLRSLAVAATIILMVEPESLVEPGFQMSFGATFALIVAFDGWKQVRDRVPRILRPPAVMILSSLVAGVATGPVAAAHFNRIAAYGLVANLLATPVMGVVVMPAGVVAALLAPLGLAAPALWLVDLGTRAILWIAAEVAGWSGAVSAVPAPPPWVLPLLAAGGLIAGVLAGASRLAGILLIAIAALGWGRADRPALLIDSGGQILGLMTDAGRALSRPEGAGFVAKNWLEDDGDLVSQEEAFARGTFDGARGLSRALWQGAEVLHLTGRTAPDRAVTLCAPGSLLVVAGRVHWPDGRVRDCDLWDQARLSATGAVAMSVAAPWGSATGVGSLSITTARDLSGDRLWTRWARDSPAHGIGNDVSQ
jgi:competence protein ComEC